MNNNGPLFHSRAAAEKAKTKGIVRVSDSNERWLACAREYAIAYCEKHGTVCADDVRQEMEGVRQWRPTHQNAYGGIFRGKAWRWAGEYRQSTAVSRHAGLQRMWTLKPTEGERDDHQRPDS
jgi:hypothetical protein